jgi:hypothetical protein
MTTKLLALTAVVGATIAAVPAQAATLFTIDTAKTSIEVTSNPTSCVIGACKLTASLAKLPTSFSLDVGNSFTFDFANILVGSGFGTGEASLAATLAFLTPASDAASTGGDASYLRLGGIFTGGVVAGSLDWDVPTQIVTAANGTKYSVSFGDLSGATFGARAVAPVTVKLISGAVPEPATWALMIVGFGTVGAAMRRRRSAERTTVRFA